MGRVIRGLMNRAFRCAGTVTSGGEFQVMKAVILGAAVVAISVVASGQQPANPNLVVYQGDKGPGVGKHIVWLAGDHEYRGEESLPALARIMAKHYGFKCSVFITTDPKTGFIEPGSSNISGLEALDTADLMVVFLRFQDFPDAEMQHIVGPRRADAEHRHHHRQQQPDHLLVPRKARFFAA